MQNTSGARPQATGHRGRAARLWPVAWHLWPALAALLIAGVLGVGMSLAAVWWDGSRRDRLDLAATPLALQTSAINHAVTGMEAAVRSYLKDGGARLSETYAIDRQQLEAAGLNAQRLTGQIGGTLSARLGAVLGAAADWQRGAVEPAIAAREAGLQDDPGVIQRNEAAYATYTAAYATLADSVNRTVAAARASLDTADTVRTLCVSGTVAVAALLGLLLLVASSHFIYGRVRTRFSSTRGGSHARRLLDGLPDAVLVIDPETLQLRDVNRAAETLSGTSREELLALPPVDILADSGPRRAAHEFGLPAAVAAAIAGGIAQDSYRFTWVQRSGARVQLEGLNGVAEPGGNPLLVVVLRDIRGRLEAEKEIGESRDRRDQMEAILQGVADGIVVLDPHGSVTYANDTAARILGYPTVQALIGHAIDQPAGQFDVLDEHGQPLPLELMPVRRVLAGEPEVEAVLRYRSRRGGDERWIAFRSSAVHDDQGHARFVLSILHDLTALMRAQEELRRSRDQLSAILQSVADGITVQGPSGRVVYANDAAVEILGFASEAQLLAAAGDNPWRGFALTDEAGLAIYADHLPSRQALKGERPPELLVSVRSRDGGTGGPWSATQGRPSETGDERWLVLKSTPILNEQGAVQFAVNVLHDITERRRAEQLERQALTDALTGLPNRRLVDDRLQQALLLARRNNTSLALLFMDLNRFKDINDTYGHQAGDVLLQEVGKRLQESLRASDTVARLGGDEFIMILPGARPPGAVAAAEKILQSLTRPFPIEGNQLRVGGSIGIAFFPDDAQDAMTITRHADAAMYVAKRAGRGFAVYAPEMELDEPAA